MKLNSNVQMPSAGRNQVHVKKLSVISFSRTVGGWMEQGEISFDFSGKPAGNSLETMLTKFTFHKSHLE